MKLYGKEPLAELLTDTAAENRLSHAILLSGEAGSGKRTMAKYIAKLFMCGAPPCESCAACKKIDQDTHPDIIYALDECGGAYNIKLVREKVCDTTAIKPNDGDVKIYIFDKADTLRPEAQNAMLKNIEEPQPWVKYIFLCESPSSLLTTIRSRVTEYSMPECSEESCAQCLVEQFGADRKTALNYSQMMSGNIGRCLEAINGGDEIKLMDSARHAAVGIAKKSGYLLCSALGEQSGRREFAAVLEYLAGIVSDAISVRAGAEMTSCGKNEAKLIASAYDDARLVGMLEKIYDVNSAGQLNLNLPLTAAYLTSVLI